jgi:hypothetical protein
MKFWFSLLMLVVAAAGCHRGAVSLSITGATATQGRDYLDVHCVAALDNRTGSHLVVTSAFYSAFDSLHVVVSAADGTRLADQAYALHQSPYSILGRAFVLPPGTTTQSMTIPVFGLTNAPAKVSLQLTGKLSQSSYTGALASEPVAVAVRRP